MAQVTIDVPRFEVRVNRRLVELTNREFEIFRGIKDANGRVVGRRELKELAGIGRRIDQRAVDQYVSRLRRKLKKAGGSDIIRSVTGRGYKYSNR